MAFDVQTLVALPGDPGGDNKQIFLLKAPLDGVGGGLTLLDASAVNTAATGAGTSFSYQLLKYSSAGTPAVNGTISAAIGGTATPWAANVPKAFVLDSAYAFLDAGEWLVLDYQEDTSGNPTNSAIVVHYILGK